MQINFTGAGLTDSGMSHMLFRPLPQSLPPSSCMSHSSSQDHLDFLIKQLQAPGHPLFLDA